MEGQVGITHIFLKFLVFKVHLAHHLFNQVLDIGAGDIVIGCWIEVTF